MNEEERLNEEAEQLNREIARPRRRRSEMHRQEASAQAEPAGEAAEQAGSGPEEMPVRTADNRIPPEARRMTASPYGTESSTIPRRPGTRPAQAVRRPVQEARGPLPETRRIRPERERPESYPVREARNAEGTDERPRVSVGYAPGRMGMNPRAAQEYAQDPLRNREPGQPARRDREQERAIYGRKIYGQETYSREPRNPESIRAIQAGRNQARPSGDGGRGRVKRHPVLTVTACLLLVIGLLLAVLLILPKDNTLRTGAENIAKTVTEPVTNLLNRQPKEISAFTVTGNERTTAPADVIFSVTTDNTVKELRLADEDGVPVEAGLTQVENTENTIWTLTLRVRDGYEGLIHLQTRGESGEWQDTEYSAALGITPPLAAETGTEGSVPAEEMPPENGESTEAAEDGSGEPAGGEAAEEAPADLTEETPEEVPEEAAGEEDQYGDDLWGVPWGGQTEAPAEAEAEETPAPTDTPEPTPEPTPTPPLTAQADPGADPGLITTTVVYDGSKKQKEYMRPAKSLIHMPAGEDYTLQKIGVLTFRGDAFRQNAAVGEVGTPSELVQIWQTEAGSSRGASQTFYGYEWTGQPAIVKWSTQVRGSSNIDEEKRTKKALREVIIAGVDGVIRFMDLEDGVLTRSAINLGYPMKGTPSLHPAGYPYMNVGQYTRKMKNKTGTIGLRQYNLYSQKELGLIDGLDGKLHRGYNRIGSFETSSLIDRTSDTMITLGTNGLLYLTSLNSAFDYKMGTLSTSPSTIVMASKAKGQKKTERMAVESSHAMYDRYVFYADMGGVLRCVDTNYLAPVWAVETGDAVMAAVALDLNESGGLDLYTANMLANRSKGNAQIRRYDALSGREIWTVEVGVSKNSKTKEDVGVKASPVIGRNGLSDLVFFTVTGLNEEGRTTLGVAEDTKAALVALDKETGTLRWAKGLTDRSESSPVAVYDQNGSGWVIQCAEDGTVLLLDGATGEQTAELQIEGKIKASPAVYNDIMVIGTTGKGTEFVYGIQIR